MDQITSTIFQSFCDSTKTLPEEVRLSFLLYLEGLNCEEIAFILNTEETNIYQFIEKAKLLTVQDLSSGDFGT